MENKIESDFKSLDINNSNKKKVGSQESINILKKPSINLNSEIKNVLNSIISEDKSNTKSRSSI